MASAVTGLSPVSITTSQPASRIDCTAAGLVALIRSPIANTPSIRSPAKYTGVNPRRARSSAIFWIVSSIDAMPTETRYDALPQKYRLPPILPETPPPKVTS